MTPIKVRGKRGSTPAEKWRHGTSHKRPRNMSPGSLHHSPGVTSSLKHLDSTLRRRKRRDPPLSKLEQLPTEILQAIFAHSGNLDLALASPILRDQLSSPHMYLTFTSRVMSPLMGNDRPTPSELSAARRLLSSKFMTWHVWKTWLGEQLTSSDLHSVPGSIQYYKEVAHSLLPRLRDVPPTKLLHGPWSEDKVNFLSTLVLDYDIMDLSPTEIEIALVGLGQAIAEGSLGAVCLLLKLGLCPDTTLLRKAVMVDGCDMEIVKTLIESPNHDIDILDAPLWSWADKASEAGDHKGGLLREYLSI